MTDFPCTQCGECCKHIGLSFNPDSLAYKKAPTVIKDLIDSFPYKINPDNSCSMLTSDNLCSVYDERPIICNIKMGGFLLRIDQKTWYKTLADQCNTLITNAGLDPKYLVNLEQKPKEASQTYEEGRSGPRKKRRRKTSQKRT